MDHKETLNAFMQAWINEDYEQMHQFSQKTWKANNSEDAIKALFLDAKLKKFNIFSTTFVSNAAMKCNVDITLKSGDRLMSVVMVICEEKPYQARAYGEWGVNPASVQNIISKITPEPKESWKKPKVKKATPEQIKKAKSNAKE